MRFYQLWEELNNRISQEDFYKLVKNFWGDCTHYKHPMDSVVACDNLNRHLVFHYAIQLQIVNIAFGWNDKPETVSSKDNSVFSTGKELQPGTLEGMHKFINLAKAFKSHGLKVSFSTSGRRKNLYDRALTMAGYQKTDKEGIYA
jgi:hypothetical protein